VEVIITLALLGIGVAIVVSTLAVRWVRNNALPVLSTPARVVAKQTGYEKWRNNRRLRTLNLYYATFELDTGQRIEFSVGDNQFGALIVGDQGTLTYQGTRYRGFQHVGR